MFVPRPTRHREIGGRERDGRRRGREVRQRKRREVELGKERGGGMLRELQEKERERDLMARGMMTGREFVSLLQMGECTGIQKL